jgi:hypothetical protein
MQAGGTIWLSIESKAFWIVALPFNVGRMTTYRIEAVIP